MEEENFFLEHEAQFWQELKRSVSTPLIDSSLIGENTDNFLEKLFKPFVKELIPFSITTKSISKEIFKRRFKIDSNIFDLVDKLSSEGIRFMLAGGKVRDWFLNLDTYESTNDYDLWFPTQEDFSRGIKYFEGLCIDGTVKEKYVKGHLFEYHWKGERYSWKVQCMKTSFSCVEELLQDFDIAACGIGYDGEYIYWTKDCLRDIRSKVIRFQKFRPNKLVWPRVLKYINKGFSIANADFAIASLVMLSTVTDFDVNQDNLKKFLLTRGEAATTEKQVGYYPHKTNERWEANTENEF